MEKQAKAMIVSCEHAFCYHNAGNKCTLDKITLSFDGLCQDALDRLKYGMSTREHSGLKEYKPLKEYK